MVGLARCRVAGGVVVNEYQRVCGVDERRAKYLARMSNAFIETAERNFLNLHEPVPRVEEDDAHRLLLQGAHFRADEIINQIRRIDFRLRERLAGQPAAKSERCGKLHRFGRADALDGSQFLHCAFGNSRERLKPGKEIAGDIHRVRSLPAGSQHDRNEFAIA